MKTDNRTVILLICLCFCVLTGISAYSQTQNSATIKQIFVKVPIIESKITHYQHRCVLDEKDFSMCDGTLQEYVITGFTDKALDDKIIIDGKVKDSIITDAEDKEKPIYAVWDYDIGDRNMQEYGGCRQYEIDRGVCHEIY